MSQEENKYTLNKVKFLSKEQFEAIEEPLKNELYCVKTDKLNADCSNITDVGKTFIAHQAMPSNTKIVLTLPASGTVMVAPADGYVYFCRKCTATGAFDHGISNQSTRLQMRTFYGIGGSSPAVFTMVKKGDEFVTIWNDENYNGKYDFYFIYAVGSESEAQ